MLNKERTHSLNKIYKVIYNVAITIALDLGVKNFNQSVKCIS